MTDSQRSALLISIRPKYLQKILSGEKNVEIRRIRPRVSEGATIVFYASSPQKQLIAFARITSVESSTPQNLWNIAGAKSALTRTEFLDYLSGCSMGVAISFEDIEELNPPISLSQLRSIWPEFQPPQTHIFLTEAQIQDVHTEQLVRYAKPETDKEHSNIQFKDAAYEILKEGEVIKKGTLR